MRTLIAARHGCSSHALAQALRDRGHAVDQVESEDAARDALKEPAFELAIVDLGMGREPGPALIGRLRAHAVKVPILALASSPDPMERIAALDLGSDDCVAAPARLEEIMARVRVWVRRGMGSASNVVCHGPLTFHAEERRVLLEGRQVKLSRRELSLLEILMSRRGRYVTKDRLAEIMFSWGDDMTLNSIEVYMHRLRKKIEAGPVRILSYRRIGYQLETIRL